MKSFKALSREYDQPAFKYNLGPMIIINLNRTFQVWTQGSEIQGDPNRNFLFQMAPFLKW